MQKTLAKLNSLLSLQRRLAVGRLEKLHEPVRLLDRDLCELPILVKYVKQIALGYLFCGQIANEQAGAKRKLVPYTLSYVHAFILQKFVIDLLDLRTPRPLCIRWLRYVDLTGLCLWFCGGWGGKSSRLLGG